jgi:hypothetical protein
VKFEFQYVSDSLWGFKSQQNSQFESWNRFRATVNIDFGKPTGQDGCTSTRPASRKAAAISGWTWGS